jgi:hypothetical protein
MLNMAFTVAVAIIIIIISCRSYFAKCLTRPAVCEILDSLQGALFVASEHASNCVHDVAHAGTTEAAHTGS